MKILTMVLMAVMLMVVYGCNSGGITTTVTENGKITITQDTRGTVQDRGTVLGLDLQLPDPSGLTGMPALVRIRLGYIANDFQAVPWGSIAKQTKDYIIDFFGSSTIKATNEAGLETK